MFINCSLSTVLTVVDQTLQNINILGISHYYDFCSFWSIAVNIMDKPQFCSF